MQAVVTILTGCSFVLSHIFQTCGGVADQLDLKKQLDSCFGRLDKIVVMILSIVASGLLLFEKSTYGRDTPIIICFFEASLGLI